MLEGIIGLIAGLVVGGSITALIINRKAGPTGTVEALKRETETFRDEVNEHFVQTAELINQLTDSYKEVFDHLSEGAEKLVAPEVIRERMPQVTDEEVRLKRIGTTMATAAASEAQEQEPEQQQEPENQEQEPHEEQDQQHEQDHRHDADDDAAATESDDAAKPEPEKTDVATEETALSDEADRAEHEEDPAASEADDKNARH